MKLAIYGSRRQEPYLEQIRSLLTLLDEASDEVVMHTKLYNYLLHLMPTAMKCVKRVTDSADFVADAAVSIGGDGSFLRTAAWVGDKEIPIVGVNTGHLGFLASLSVDQLSTLPAMLAGGHYRTEARSLIEVDCPGLRGWPYALNEVAIAKGESASIIDVKARIDGADLADYRADGLIIATPTGSTAYNLSVGGPIVQPTAPVMVLSPVAAHSLSLRPLVVGDTSVLTFTCDSRAGGFRISVDGRSTDVALDTRVTLRRAPFAVRVIMPEGSNFAATLREKLDWK